MTENYVFKQFMWDAEDTPDQFEPQGAGKHTLLQKTGNKDAMGATLEQQRQEIQQKQAQQGEVQPELGL